MPESRVVLEIRERTIGSVRAARAEVAQLDERVGFAWADPRLSEQGRSEEAAAAVEEARAEILETFDIARGDVNAGLGNVERVLGQLTGVTPEEMSAAR